MTPEQVERLLRRYAAQLPASAALDAARAETLRAQIAGLAAGETGRVRFASVLRTQWLLGAAAAVVLAAIWMAAPRLPHAAGIGFEVALGPTADELFHVQRATPSTRASGSVFVGVRPERDAYVRILARDHLDRIESLGLDRQGATTIAASGGQAVVFGAFAIEHADAGGIARLTHLVVVCSPDPISEESVQAALRELERKRAAGQLGAVGAWADWLAERLGVQARVQAVEP